MEGGVEVEEEGVEGGLETIGGMVTPSTRPISRDPEAAPEAAEAAAKTEVETEEEEEAEEEEEEEEEEGGRATEGGTAQAAPVVSTVPLRV